MPPLEPRIVFATIEGGFWEKRRRLIAEKTLWAQLEILEGKPMPRPDQNSTVIENFRIAAGLEHRPFRGLVCGDSELGKWIEAAAYSLRAYPDPELENRLDEIVDLVCEAQEADGYLNTFFQVSRPAEKWAHYAFACEMYDIGHLMEGAAALSKALGKRKLLWAMEKTADLLCAKIGPEPEKAHVYDGHAEIELGLLRLYDETGKDRYLRLAEYLVKERGKQPSPLLTDVNPVDSELRDGRWFGLDHHQAQQPVTLQRNADGHAVKLTYLYSAAAELCALGLDPDNELWKAVRAVWNSAVGKRMYVTGAIGSQAYAERMTKDYDLPDDRGYAETCASIGLCFWAERMTGLDTDGAYADVAERALYNGVLAGWSLDGLGYFYANVLHVDPEITAYRQDCAHVEIARQPWFECACCPTNLIRFLMSMERYCYHLRDGTLYVDQFAEGRVCIAGDGGETVLRIQTGYPFDEKVTIRAEASAVSGLRLSLRIPGWCGGALPLRNGRRAEGVFHKGYFTFEETVSAGDEFTLTLPMPVRMVYANPRVWNAEGKACLVRGPLVYCVESCDHPDGLAGLWYVPDAAVTPYRGKGILEGITVLRGDGLRAAPGNALYSNRRPVTEGCRFTAIPYFAWGNRGVGAMDVWRPYYAGSSISTSVP